MDPWYDYLFPAAVFIVIGQALFGRRVKGARRFILHIAAISIVASMLVAVIVLATREADANIGAGLLVLATVAAIVVAGAQLVDRR